MLGDRSRAFTFGALLGALASVVRVPLGIDLFRLPAVDASTAYGARAGALFAVGCACALATSVFRTERRPTPWILAGATTGFVLHARILLQQSTAGWTRLLGLAVALWLVAAWVGRRGGVAEELPKRGRGAFFLECFGTLLLGTSASMALESIARHARLLGTQHSLEESVLAACLIASAFAGAVAFGSLLGAEQTRRAAWPVALAAVPVLCIVSLNTLLETSTLRGWDRFVRSYGLAPAERGTWPYVLLIGGTLFTIPGFALGTGLHACGRRQWTWLFFGAGLGLLRVPEVLATITTVPLPTPIPNSASLVKTACMTAGIGAICTLLVTAGISKLARSLALVASSGALAIALWYPLRAVVIHAPWSVRPVFPSLVMDTPEGLVTVEPTGQGIENVTLDRREIAPSADDALADRNRLSASFAVLPHALRESREVRVLLIGQLTPGRALALELFGASRVDRTAAWWKRMERLEEHLFRHGSFERPAGDVLDREDARARLESGAYDLVIVPAVVGEPPFANLGELPPGTTLVAWFDSARFLAHRELGERGILASAGFHGLSVGLVRGADPEAFDERERGAPRWIALGEPTRHPLAIDWLRRIFELRIFPAQAAFARRLELAQPEDPLLVALGHHYAMQELSSRWDSKEVAIELDETTLGALREAAIQRPDHFTEALMNELATILVGKRWIEPISEFLEPVVEAHGPWIELEKALVHAELEGLLFEDAHRRLDALSERAPGDRELDRLRGRTFAGQGDARGAIEAFARALDGGREPTKIRYELAVQLIAAYDGDAVERARELPPPAGTDPQLEAQIESLLSGEDHHGHDH